jgi:hypothetical protein
MATADAASGAEAGAQTSDAQRSLAKTVVRIGGPLVTECLCLHGTAQRLRSTYASFADRPLMATVLPPRPAREPELGRFSGSRRGRSFGSHL